MRFASFFSILATAVVAVNAADPPNSDPSAAAKAIAQALKKGDFIGAANDLLTLGSCDISNDAECLSAFAPIVVDCGTAALAQGGDAQKNLDCFSKALDALGSGPGKIGACTSCIEEGISIVQSLLESN